MAKTPEPFIEQRFAPARVVETTEDGSLYFEAVVAQANFLNENGRYYPLEVLWPAFERINDQLASHPGAVDHPDPFAPVAAEDLGISWQGFTLEGTSVVGRGKIIPTSKGRDLRAVIEAGVSIGFSTRGYGQTRSEEREGRKANVMYEYDFSPDGSVDAVVRPSVKHAKIRNYRKEGLDLEIEEIKAALATAEAALATANAKATTAEAALSVAEAALTAAQTKLATLESEAVGLRAEGAKAALEATITALIGEHRFAATVRTELSELRAAGVTVTAENAEKVVARLKALVEGAATASAEGSPRGDLSTTEDKPAAAPKAEDLTADQKLDLAAMGL